MESANYFSSRPECNNTPQRCLLSLCALLFQKSHLFLIGVVLTYNDSKKDLHTLCQIPRNWQCKWLEASYSGSRNFCKLLWVSCEVSVLRGYGWIHWVARSCTTTAYRWLFRDSQFSLRTLWSAGIKSPKFSARSTAPPLRLLHGALVILWQISKFRSSVKWILTLCLPKSALLEGVGCKDGSWEELRVWALCSWTLFIHKIFSEFLQPFQYVGIRTGLSVLDRCLRFIWFWVFGWFSQQLLFWKFRGARVSPFLPFDTFTRHSCGIVIHPAQVSPCLSSHAVGGHSWRWHGWWGRRAWWRRKMNNFLTWRCHGCWRGQAWGRTRR